MRAIASLSPRGPGKQRLLTSCAIVAGMMALAYGGPTLAQVAGSGTITTLPSGTTTGTGVNPSTVNVNGPQSIVDWTPSNTPVAGVIDFLPTGNTLNYVGDTTGYVVLNRFVDGAGTSITDQIALNGIVNSYVGSTTGPRGGNIWFYNAGGILIGASGVINVGSLVLTSNDIVTTGGLFGPGGQIRFNGASGSTSAVTVNGAINANNNGNPGSSYVALVAPRVVQAGAVRVDGSAAYVAAEQAEIRINPGNGLFDINVTVGAEGGNVITHSGSTTGPAHQQGDIDASRIYMVAIPKNDAVTMLVSGAIGYDDALSAQVDPDGAVRLSAGYNIVGGELATTPVNATAANITAGDTLFRSDTVARASNIFAAQPTQPLPGSPPPLSSAGQFFVEGSGTFIGDASATVSIGANQSGGATGTFTVQSGGRGSAPGNAAINVTGGTLSAPGALTIEASGTPDALTGDSQGGTASLTVTGGSVTTSGVTVEANGFGDRDAGGSSGNGRGGNASISVSGTGSSLTVGNIFINALGTGDRNFVSGPPAVNGSGTGGTVSLTVAAGGSVGPAALLSLDARGLGGIGLTQSGDGTGGTARITVSGTGSFLSTTQSFVQATGEGGRNVGGFVTQNGGNGTGGTAEILINADATSLVSLGALGASGFGRGGDAGGSENTTGGDALGGIARLTVDGGVNAQFTSITLDASAAAGAATTPSGTTGQGGNARANNVTLAATNGSTISSSGLINLFAVGMNRFPFNPAGENFGSGTGGNIAVNATAGGAITTGNRLIVQAMGGSMSDAVRQSAGNGLGGNVDFLADGGTIVAEVYEVDASSSTAHVTGAGGTAQGGTIDLFARNGGEIRATLDATNQLNASAASGSSAAGTAATGGTIQLIADGGRLDLGVGADLIAGGASGGAVTAGATDPTGTGGTILIQTAASSGSEIDYGQLFAATDGRTAVEFEVPGGPIDTSGNGRGGTVTLDVQGGTLSGGLIELSASGFGSGGSADGTGGTATFTQTGGDISVSDMSVSADGFGGIAPGVSGTGTGGIATIDLSGGTITAADITASASGEGRSGVDGSDEDPANITAGGTGGAGIGGNAVISIGGTAVVDAGVIEANAKGTGGIGGAFNNFFSFGASPGTPGNGGNGTGGTASVNLAGGSVTASSVIADASGIGGEGGSSFFSSSSGGATGVGVGGTGGTGRGGRATIALAATAGAIGEISAVSLGIGGLGGTHNVGGMGGDGYGGITQAIIDDFDAGTLAISLDSTTEGGNGGDARDGRGGDGGDAFGGTSSVIADGPNATVEVTQANFLTSATGGNGGNGNLGFGSSAAVAPSGGDGGGAEGGAVEAIARDGAAMTLGLAAGDVVELGSTGVGGNGGNGSAADFGAGNTGGDGGLGGGGRGGSVRLIADGGTITTAGESLEIDVSGQSGSGGAGGLAGGGGSLPGSGGDFAGTAGGRVSIESLTTGAGAGLVDLGNTNIFASGDTAGRVEIRSGARVNFTSLEVEVRGLADPTNNDTDMAPAGIFLGATGGTIETGSLTLGTDGSIGLYAEGAGRVIVGETAQLQAGDQIDIRHDLRGANAAPTLEATDDLVIVAGTSIAGAPGSLLGAGGLLSLTGEGTGATIGVDRLDATDISISSSGAASVEHAEAVNDFTASAGSFRTALNSIITGGDISITSPGAVDLGNSTAGAFVSVDGESIAFNTIVAGSSVSLFASGTATGAEGISGGSIDSGGSVDLNATRIAIAGTVEGDGFLFASGSAGPVAINLANFASDISISATGDITGTYNADGDIRLNSGADINATANATGAQSSSSGPPIASRVYADAAGDLTLTNSNAAGMFGVNAGGSVSLSGIDAGEDLLVRAGTTATLTNATAGDDLTVRAAVDIVASGLTTSGAGADAQTLDYNDNPASSIGFFTSTSAPDGSNIDLASSTGNVGVNSANAFGNLTATAAGVVTSTGTLQSGLATRATGNSIALATVVAGTDIDLNAAGSVSVEHAEAANDFNAAAGSVRTGLNSIITGGDISITSPGAVDLGNSTAGGFVQVQGQSIAFNAITAGLSVGLSADGTAAGAEGINGGSIAAGEDINLFANSIALTGDVTGAASLFAVGTGGAVSVNEADVGGNISIFSAADLSGTYISGGNIFLNSDANINASAEANGGYVDRNGLAAEGNLFVIAAGNASLTESSAARMFGVNAGAAASIDGGTAGEDILVIAGTTASLTDVTGGDDITVRAPGNIDALNVRTTGAGADTHILDFSTASGSPTFTIGTGEGSQGINGADIVMASTAGAIDAATLSAGDDILLNAANSIAVNGATTLGLGTTGGDSSIRTQGGATTLAGLDAFSDVVVDAAGIANLTGVVAAGRNATITAQGATLAALTGPSGTATPTLSADGDVVVNSSAGITGGGVRALGDATLTAGTAIGITSIEGQDVTLTGATGVAADQATVLGTTSLDSGGGNIQLGSLIASGLISASANAIRIEGGGDMHFATLTTDVGDAYVRGGGDFSVATGTVAGTADLGTQGEAMTIGNLTAANAIIENAGGFLNLDTVSVTGNLAATARTSLGINGVVTGQSISLASAGISIAPTGRVGTAGVTQQLSVANNNADNQTFVGGAAGPNGPNGYHIDADELTRLYGAQIEIFAPAVQAAGVTSVGSAAPPDVIVDDFTMTGGASNSNLGANGALTIRTPGKMRVIGNVQLTGLTDANALNLRAADAIEVILGRGSVRLVNGAAPAGQLNMASDDIIVATQAAITAVGAATTIDAINSRLAENDGVVLDEGALFARGIRADVAGGFYVQNSGAGTDAALRRGLTFGAGGLDVSTQGSSRIVINGVHLGPNGQVTGLDTIGLLTIRGVVPVIGTYDRRSTFNGCFIANTAACTTVALEFENNFPVQDIIDEEVDDDDGVGEGNTLPQALITMRDIDPMTGEPLLDDPVTGAGNDDLWTPPAQ